MASKPTQRTLAYCRKLEWPVQVVERFNPHSLTRLDLFGCIDIVALDGQPGVLGIQACAGGDVSKRRTKALEQPHLRAWLDAGNRFEVWGWRQVVAYRKDGSKAVRKKWELRRVPVTIDELRPGSESDHALDEIRVRGESPRARVPSGAAAVD